MDVCAFSIPPPGLEMPTAHLGKTTRLSLLTGRCSGMPTMSAEIQGKSLRLLCQKPLLILLVWALSVPGWRAGWNWQPIVEASYQQDHQPWWLTLLHDSPRF